MPSAGVYLIAVEFSDIPGKIEYPQIMIYGGSGTIGAVNYLLSRQSGLESVRVYTSEYGGFYDNSSDGQTRHITSIYYKCITEL